MLGWVNFRLGQIFEKSKKFKVCLQVDIFFFFLSGQPDQPNPILPYFWNYYEDQEYLKINVNDAL